MRRNHLFLVAAFIWGVPGLSITLKGISAYNTIETSDLWWLLLVTAVVCAGFFFMFRKIVDRYSDRIQTLPDNDVNAFMTFPLKGWLLLVFMMGLGMLLKYMPGVPPQFTASFYSGLGPMLLLSAMRFLMKMCRASCPSCR